MSVCVCLFCVLFLFVSVSVFVSLYDNYLSDQSFLHELFVFKLYFLNSKMYSIVF